MKKVIFTIIFIVLVSCSKKSAIDNLNRGKATFKINNAVKDFTQLNSFNNGVLTLGNTKEEVVSLFFPVPTTSLPITYNTQTSGSLISATYILKECVATVVLNIEDRYMPDLDTIEASHICIAAGTALGAALRLTCKCAMTAMNHFFRNRRG